MRNSRESERERRGGIQEKRREDERGEAYKGRRVCVCVEMPVSVEAKLQGAIKKVIEDVAGRPDRLGVRG